MSICNTVHTCEISLIDSICGVILITK